MHMEKRRRAAISLFLAVVVFAVYFPVLSYDFLHYDDGIYVTENSRILSGLSRENIVWAFANLDAAFWHPFTWLSLLADAHLFGLDASGFHLTALLLHIANSLCLFGLLVQWTGQTWKSAFVAALFALHPLHVESVAWIAQRKDLLSTLFWFLTLSAYTAYVRRGGAGRYGLALLLFVFGLMSKPMLVTVPCVMLLLDYWPLGRTPFLKTSHRNAVLPLSPEKAGTAERSIAFLITEKLPFFVCAALAGAAAVIAQGQSGSLASMGDVPFADRAANALFSYGSYLLKTLWPQGLSVLYPLESPVPAWKPFFGGTALLAVSLLAVSKAKKNPYLAVGWLWYVGTLVPVIGLVQVGSHAMADRYTYVTIVGLFIMAAWGVPELLQRVGGKKHILWIAGVSALAGFSAVSRVQVGHWKSDEALFAHAVAVTGENPPARLNLGAALSRQGRPEDALAHYEKALAVKPDFAWAYNNKGVVLAKLGRFDEAVFHYEKALTLQPDYHEAHSNFGEVLAKLGRNEEAAAHLREALRLKPDCAEALVNLGWISAEQGRAKEAIEQFREAVQFRPGLPEAHFSLAFMLWKQDEKGKKEQAAQHLTKALALRPDYGEAHHLLGKSFAEQGLSENASRHFLKAIALLPSPASARADYGVLLLRMGRASEAVEELRSALNADPGLAEARLSMAVALVRLDRLDEAAGHCLEALRTRPDYPEAHLQLGVIRARQNRLNDAADRFSRALAVRPDYAEAHLNLGRSLELLGKPAQALPHYEEAVRLMPQWADARVRLGQTYWVLGETHFAEKELEALRGLDRAAFENLKAVLQEASADKDALPVAETP